MCHFVVSVSPIPCLCDCHVSSLSRSIRVPDYFHFQPDTPDTPERHPHYATRMTTSINSESIINNTVGSIDFIAVASDT